MKKKSWLKEKRSVWRRRVDLKRKGLYEEKSWLKDLKRTGLYEEDGKWIYEEGDEWDWYGYEAEELDRAWTSSFSRGETRWWRKGRDCRWLLQRKMAKEEMMAASIAEASGTWQRTAPWVTRAVERAKEKGSQKAKVSTDGDLASKKRKRQKQVWKRKEQRKRIWQAPLVQPNSWSEDRWRNSGHVDYNKDIRFSYDDKGALQWWEGGEVHGAHFIRGRGFSMATWSTTYFIYDYIGWGEQGDEAWQEACQGFHLCGFPLTGFAAWAVFRCKRDMGCW